MIVPLAFIAVICIGEWNHRDEPYAPRLLLSIYPIIRVWFLFSSINNPDSNYSLSGTLVHHLSATCFPALPYPLESTFMKNKLLFTSILLLVVSCFAIYSCGKSSGYNSGTTPPAPASNSVSIVNMSFSPSSLTVTAGTTVTWTNNDGMTHTTTSNDPGFDSGNMTAGTKFTHSFSTPGTYAYHCSIHSGMTGTITVKY
jgi:plastocyanin